MRNYTSSNIIEFRKKYYNNSNFLKHTIIGKGKKRLRIKKKNGNNKQTCARRLDSLLIFRAELARGDVISAIAQNSADPREVNGSSHVFVFYIISYLAHLEVCYRYTQCGQSSAWSTAHCALFVGYYYLLHFFHFFFIFFLLIFFFCHERGNETRLQRWVPGVG